MRMAPNAGGFFVGDYAGLVNAANQFQAIYSIATPTAGNPTDMIAQRATATTSTTADEPDILTTGSPRPRITAPNTRR